MNGSSNSPFTPPLDSGTFNTGGASDATPPLNSGTSRIGGFSDTAHSTFLGSKVYW